VFSQILTALLLDLAVGGGAVDRVVPDPVALEAPEDIDILIRFWFLVLF